MPRIFPLVIQWSIDLDTIKTIADLDAKADHVAAAARDAIFRELVKREPPPPPADRSAPDPEVK